MSAQARVTLAITISLIQASYPTDAAAFRGGVREALGVPAAVLGAGYIGFGSLAAEYGYSIGQIIVATLAVWALPGQLIMIEMSVVGAPAVVIVAAVVMSAARFLPMTMTLMPMLRGARYRPAANYPAAQLASMTTWAVAVQRCPGLAAPSRLPYFVGFGVACLAVSAACGALGHLLTGMLPPLVRLGFVFLAPVYFFVILVGDVRTRLAAVALACGALAGPLFHLVSPQWSVMLAGFAGGTAAYCIQKAHGRRPA
jgi:predicted branched-subunit amino acid permease